MTDITLLDGSIGQEPARHANQLNQRLWSTRTIIDHPDMVRALHSDDFAGGAAFATTNSYTLHRSRLAPFDMEPELPALIDIAQAESARTAYPGQSETHESAPHAQTP